MGGWMSRASGPEPVGARVQCGWSSQCPPWHTRATAHPALRPGPGGPRQGKSQLLPLLSSSPLAAIETLLCYLELHPQRWVEVLHPTLSSCRLLCYGGPQQLRTVARR